MTRNNAFEEAPALPLAMQGAHATPPPRLDPPDPQHPHFLAHRGRLRDRFMRAGHRALADYEMLEMLLLK